MSRTVVEPSLLHRKFLREGTTRKAKAFGFAVSAMFWVLCAQLEAQQACLMPMPSFSYPARAVSPTSLPLS